MSGMFAEAIPAAGTVLLLALAAVQFPSGEGGARRLLGPGVIAAAALVPVAVMAGYATSRAALLCNACLLVHVIALLRLRGSGHHRIENVLVDALILLLIGSALQVAYPVLPAPLDAVLAWSLPVAIVVTGLHSLFTVRGTSGMYRILVISIMPLVAVFAFTGVVETSGLIALRRFLVMLIAGAWAAIAGYAAQTALRQRENDLAREQADVSFSFRFIRELQHATMAGDDADTLLGFVLNPVCRILGADGAGLLVYRGGERVELARVGSYVPVSEFIDLQPDEALHVADLHRDTRPVARRHARSGDAYLSSLIILPVASESVRYGHLVLQKRTYGSGFDDEAFQRSRMFADFARLSIEHLNAGREKLLRHEMETEIAIAAGIQQKLLPAILPEVQGMTGAVYYAPARGVGGDYYDCLVLPDGRVLVVIADVAGKGLPASLVTVMIRTIVHLAAPGSRHPATLLRYINRGLAASVDIDRYATVTMLMIDTAERRIEYANAGHHPGILLRKGAVPREITAEGIPAGVYAGATYTNSVAQYQAGDTLLLYTDGISEALSPDGEQFGVKRIITASESGDSAPAQVERLRVALDSFTEGRPPNDDRTFIVISLT